MTPVEIRNIYVLIQVIGCVILTLELIYVSLQKPSNLQKHFIIILLMFIISFLGYLIELIADTKMGSFIGCSLGYVSKPFAMVANMFLLCEYANIKIKKPFIIAIIVFFIFLSLMEMTNPLHYQYYSYVEYDPTKIGSPLKVGHGLFWYIYMAASFLIFFAYSGIVFYEFKQSKTKQAKQMAVLLFFVALFAFVGLFLFIFGLTYNYDTTLFGMMLSSLMFLILLTKYRMFDALTTAQNKALNENGDGLLVLDARLALTYYNDTASEILPELKENMGRTTEHIIISELDKLNTKEPIFIKDKVYELVVDEDYVGRRKILIGKSYIFKDITEHYYRGENLKKEVNKVTSKLVSLQRNALVAFAGIVEARDGNTGEHIKNVSTGAYLIARELKNNPNYKGLDDKYIEMIRECAPLHDIGKVYISDSILLKPGKLTPEEMEVMHTHPQKGYEIIEQAVKQIEEPIYVKTCQEIALGHHERWDGTGYPKKLKGDKIPLSARIVAVADVYDALRMKRSYKDAYSKEKAIEIIKEETGTHFDPEIVEAFLKIVDKVG